MTAGAPATRPAAGAPAAGAHHDPPEAPGAVAGPVAALAVIALAGVVVGAATESGAVRAVAYLLAALVASAALLTALGARALRPVPAPASVLTGAPAAALRAMPASHVAAHAAEIRRVHEELAARARRAGGHASALAGAGLGLLVLALPVFWAGDALPGGRAGALALLVVAAAPVAGLALVRAVLLGEWSPPLVPPAAFTAGPDAALRVQAARHLVACAVTEVVAARRARLVHLMTWLLGVEAAWLIVVAALRVVTR
ncbi:MAG TPA: hypothetical protein VNT51_10380 [Miltoncostaeaceae bacterium]|nr:hypothetical protein [Miltoncostaeaceae bacterium]